MNYASSPRSVAKKRRITRHGGSSSENWKPGIHINNIPYYRQRLQFSSNPRRTSLRNRRWLQKVDRRPHWLVRPLLLLRDDLMGVTAVVVVSLSRICLGFSSIVVVGLKLSWSDESMAIVWENRRLHENGSSDRLLLSHLSFGFWFWERIRFWFLGFWEERGVTGFSPFSLKRVTIVAISRSLCVLGSSACLITLSFLHVPIFLSFFFLFFFFFKRLVSFYTKRLPNCV